MPRQKLPMRLIQDPSRRKRKHATSLKCVKKKAEQLSKLCDTDVAVIVVGPNGEVQTWPEEMGKLYAVLNKYHNCPKEVREKYELGLPWFLAERAVEEHQKQQQQSQSADAAEAGDVALTPPPKEKMIAGDPLQAMNQRSILDTQPLASSDPYLVDDIIGGSSSQSAAHRDLDIVQINDSSSAGIDDLEWHLLANDGGYSGCFPTLTDFEGAYFSGGTTVPSAFDSSAAIGFASTSSAIFLPKAQGPEIDHVYHPCNVKQQFRLMPNDFMLSGSGAAAFEFANTTTECVLPLPPPGKEMVDFNQLNTADECFALNAQSLDGYPGPSPINSSFGLSKWPRTTWNFETVQLGNCGLPSDLLCSGELINSINQHLYNSDFSSSLDNDMVLRAYQSGTSSSATIAVTSPLPSYDDAQWLQTALQSMPSYGNADDILQTVDDIALAHYLGSVNQRI